ncbi:MAG: rhomboid family intramembrane serine protease [Methyloligellaceae bacterium]
MSQREPIFNMPAGTLHFLTVIIAVHLILAGLWYTDGTEFKENYNWVLRSLAFIPIRYFDHSITIPGGDLASYTAVITYMFVHANMEHLIINSLCILAFGSAIARRMSYGRFILYTLICGISGVGLHFWFYPVSYQAVIGASGAASGFIAGAMVLIVSAYRNKQTYLIRQNPAQIRLMSVYEFFTEPRILFIIAIWVLLNWLMGDFGLGVSGDVQVAWEAHLGGYIAGTFGIFLLDRPYSDNRSDYSSGQTPDDENSQI